MPIGESCNRELVFATRSMSIPRSGAADAPIPPKAVPREQPRKAKTRTCIEEV